MKTLKKIAITGGIGSGKSCALSILKNAGYSTLSSDEIVAKLYKKRKVKNFLKTLFPTAVTGKCFLKVDRKIISKEVFSNSEKHRLLTQNITALVLDYILKTFKRKRGKIFVEVPLLFECGYQKYFDSVMVVCRDKKIRIDSVMLRSSLSKQQVEERVNVQIDYDNLDLSSYIIIENNSTIEEFRQKILSVAISI